MDQYVLVTRYAEPGKRVIVHAYGPYTKNEAAKGKREVLKEAAQWGQTQWLSASVCKLWKEED